MGTVVIMLYHILESSWERSSRYHAEGSNRVTCRRLLNRVALIVSRCKRVLNHHVRRLKHMHFLFVSYISVKLEKKINKSTKLWSRADWVQVSIPPLRRTETTDCSLRPGLQGGTPRCSSLLVGTPGLSVGSPQSQRSAHVGCSCCHEKRGR